MVMNQGRLITPMSIIYPHRSQNPQAIPQASRHLYRRGMRPLGTPVGKKHFLHVTPHHEKRNQAWPLTEDQLGELRALLQQNQSDAVCTDLYVHALDAGQITVA